MARRYTGGFLSATEQATDSNTANGIFSLAESQEKTALGNFPTGRWTPQRSLRFRSGSSAYLNRTSSYSTATVSTAIGGSLSTTYNLTISADTNNYNLLAAALAAGYDGKGLATVNLTINAGVVVGSATAFSPALDLTGFPTGVAINVTVGTGAYVVGKGGDGGHGGYSWGSNGAAGGDGGDAIWASTAVSITNNGTIAGGGGGGGGGGGSAPTGGYGTPGGNGGGGAGRVVGAASGPLTATAGYTSSASNPGSLTTGGSGTGSPGQSGGSGGSGGNLGAAGSAGATGQTAWNGTVAYGGAGGAAGYYARGNGFITWSTAGTRAGSVQSAAPSEIALTTFTMSAWVKRGNFTNADDQWIMGSVNYNTSTSTTVQVFEAQFKGAGSGVADRFNIAMENINGAACVLQTSGVYRDPSAWYHIVVAVDTNQTIASNRVKLYINGSRVTSFATETYPPIGTSCGFSSPSIGSMLLNGTAARFFDGYMSEMHLVADQQLDPTYFGYIDPETSTWVPKVYTGSYGSMGFYLPFTDITSSNGGYAGFGNNKAGLTYGGQNLLGYSQNFLGQSNANYIWSIGPYSASASNITDPLGGSTAWSFTSNSADWYINQQISGLPVGQTCNASVWMKVPTGTLTVNFYGYQGSPFVATGSKTVTLTTSWQRFDFDFSVVGATTSMNVQFGGASTITSGQVIHMWGAQVTIGSGVKTYVATGDRGDFYPNGFSVSVGSSYDSMVDVPGVAAVSSLTDVGGVQRGNYATLNPLIPVYSSATVLSNGNLGFTVGSNGGVTDLAVSTIPMSSGKWYAECTVTTSPSAGTCWIGVVAGLAGAARGLYGASVRGNGYGYKQSTGYKCNGDNTGLAYGATYTTGDIIGIALDLEGRTITFYKNGVSQGIAFTNITSADGNFLFGIDSDPVGGFNWNFGQRTFAYTPPAGFKSLNTTNLPAPIIKLPSEQFDVKTWTGTGGSRFIGNTQVPASNYKITKSLRLKGAGTYLQAIWGNPAGNQKTHTFSAWLKRTSIGTAEWPIYGQYTDANNRWYVRLEQNQIRAYMNVGGTSYEVLTRDAVFQDRMWHHFVLALDTTQVSPTERVKIYVDGVLMLHGSTSTYPPQNTNTRWGDNGPYAVIGCKDNDTTKCWDGNIAEVYNVDGQQLTPSSFGEFDGNGYWVPKQYTGTYGTRGFYLPLSDATSLETLTTDASNGSPELITNGRFISNVSGWTVGPGVGGSPSITLVSGSARIANSQNNGVWYYQAIPTVIGRTYYANAYVSNISIGGSTREARLKKSDNSAQSLNTVTLAVVTQATSQGSLRGSFVATATTTYIMIEADVLGTGTQGADFDNISVSEVGYKNSWNPYGISLTNDQTYDSLVDSPTIYETNNDNVDNGGEVRADYCVLDRGTERPYIITAYGGLYGSANGTGDSVVDGSLPVLPNSKIYIEAYYQIQAGAGNTTILAVSDNFPYSTAATRPGSFAGSWGYDYRLGNAWNQGTSTAVNAMTTSGNTIMWAIDLAAGKMWAGANGTWYNSGNPATGANPTVSGITNTRKIFQVELDGGASNRSSLDFNFGQKAFTYAPPAGFKSFNTKTLKDADNKTLATPYGVMVNNPDLVWMKARSVNNWHFLFDSVRGAGNRLMSNVTYGQSYENTTLTNFNPNGFTLGADGVGGANTNGTTHVAWVWNRGSIPGFDIVQYTGTGAIQTIPHKLGSKPKFMTFKSMSATGHWTTYHENMNGGTGDPTFGYILLNATGGFNLETAGATRTRWWGDKGPTSNEITIGAGSTDQLNVANATYVGYLWSEVPGFSKIGYYTGNGSTDGAFVYCGFRPKYLLVKRADGVSDWNIYDSVRDPVNRSASSTLFAEDTGVEASGYPVDFVSNGFKNRYSGGNPNISGAVYIYMAFAENPFKYANAR